MNIAICGGTFDPFHRGHLEPVLAVREEMQWERILYVPAHRQPFKVGHDSASGYHRFAMAALATAGIEAIWVLPWELEREAVSYTVDTLEHLRSEHPQATLDWIIGDDNVSRLGEWRSLDRILGLANFVVLSRGGEAVLPMIDSVQESGGVVRDAKQRGRCGAIVFARNAAVLISSTDIRNRVRAGEPIESFVDPRVSRYIHHYGLYRAS
jgi:nicotinate-nucleotide adenylyltransferase